MLLWLLPLVTGVGFYAVRSWRQDAALRSGELMDVRDLVPDGLVDLEVRALAVRRYRLELQFEAVTQLEPAPEGRVRRKAPKFARFPYQLSVSALGEDENDSVPIYESQRDLRDLLAVSCVAHEATTESPEGEETVEISGSVPLLEFESQSLGRMRFEFSIDLREAGDLEGRSFGGQIDKAWLVLKEDVRPLRAPASLLDSIQLDLRSLSRLISD